VTKEAIILLTATLPSSGRLENSSLINKNLLALREGENKHWYCIQINTELNPAPFHNWRYSRFQQYPIGLSSIVEPQEFKLGDIHFPYKY